MPFVGSLLQKLFFWCLVVAPSLPYVFLSIAYRRTVAYKRLSIESLMSRHGVFERYITQFGKVGQHPEDVVQKLFDLTYHPRTYVVAVNFNVAVIAAGTAIALLRAGIALGLPKALEELMRASPATLVAGIAGAYVLNLYEVLGRYRTGDLSPSSLHFTWLHMIVAAIVAPLLSAAFAPGVNVAVAFGIGVFPLKDSLDAAKDFAKKRLQPLQTAKPSEGPTLHKLQGFTEEIIDRLAEEGITSAEHLAYADPIRLLLRTNVAWAAILDLIDQALLFIYVDSGVEKLRPIGVRGSIELAAVYDRFVNAKVEEAIQRSEHEVQMIAARLELTREESLNLILTFFEDIQVNLIWGLTETLDSDDEEPQQEPPPSPGSEGCLAS